MFEPPKSERPATVKPLVSAERLRQPAVPPSLDLGWDAPAEEQATSRADAGALPTVRIVSGHRGVIGSNQAATFTADIQQPPHGNPAAFTGVDWELLREDDNGNLVSAGRGSGARFSVQPGRGRYIVRCAAERAHPAPAAPRSDYPADALAAPQRPGPDLKHPVNPYLSDREQHVHDAEPIGRNLTVVLARDQVEFQVIGPEENAKLALDKDMSDFPPASLEEELQLRPQHQLAREQGERVRYAGEQNAADNAMKAADAASANLREAVNERGFPGMGDADSHSGERIVRVNAVLAQDDGTNVHLRLFLGSFSRGDEQFLRLVELPVTDISPEDQRRGEDNTKPTVSAYDSGTFKASGDQYGRAGAFHGALDQFVQNSPHGPGQLQYEVEGGEFSGSLRKNESGAKEAAEALDKAAAVTSLLSLVLMEFPEVAVPFRLLSVALSAGAAVARVTDGYNKGEDNTADAGEAASGLLELGGELIPGSGGEVARAGKGLLDAGRHAATLVGEVQEGQVQLASVREVLGDALTGARVVAPDLFAPRNMKFGTRRIIFELTEAHHGFGPRLVRYLSLPEEFYGDVSDLLNKQGLSQAEKQLRVASIIKELAEGAQPREKAGERRKK